MIVPASICHLSVPESVACPSIYKSPVFLCSMYVCMCLPSCFLLACTVHYSPSMTAGRTAASRIRTRMIVVHSSRRCWCRPDRAAGTDPSSTRNRRPVSSAYLGGWFGCGRPEEGGGAGGKDTSWHIFFHNFFCIVNRERAPIICLCH